MVPIEELRRGDRKVSILVVDDDNDVRVMVAESLREFGYTVIEAASAEEALPLATRQSAGSDEPAIDMVITDVRMPGMSGLELAERLGRSASALKVIVMSGYFQHQPVARRFLHKPFRIQDLARAVRDELA